VNAKDDGGVTALQLAAFGGHKEVAELLIAEGADVNAKAGDGSTPLDWAIKRRRTEIADLLRKHGGKTQDWFKAGDSIHIAAGAGHMEAVKQHIAAGTDVNAKSEFGGTPLHQAALGGHKKIAELLIANGADVNAKMLDGGDNLHARARLFQNSQW
jgi:ankyrin repeat protein